MAVYSLGERRVQVQGTDWYIADSATVIGSVLIEDRASIWFNVVIRGDNDLITIGEGSNVQDSSMLHTDAGIKLTLGRNVSIGHMVMLHGCSIGDGSLIGINSVILSHAVIGKHSLIGAGSLITEGKSIPDGVLALGSPAKVVRDLSQAEIDNLQNTAEGYIRQAKLFRQQLQPQQI
ncbi:MAG: gamma carbonic anhydrase family protein [Betaproteobacteria bacterium RIFCSPLOWO2_12_FULL_62_13b]|nr:MAG: gamma carbonic anhydrase family protein [Betaproteobacteria bacterium RIFCSPLOWO2_12_FULL_62_13b]